MTFKTEAELCAAFITAIGEGWTAYPETQGRDILLSRNEDGFQIGIEAKLRLNPRVITQTLSSTYISITAPGPDSRAVLVPGDRLDGDLVQIATRLGIAVIVMDTRPHPYSRLPFRPELPAASGWKAHNSENDFPDWAPASRLKLPDYIPDVAAGAPSPVQLTEWKIKAIKLAIIIAKNRGAVREDFKNLSLNHRLFIDRGWLIMKDGRFIPTDTFPKFKKIHPRNYKEIMADYKKWSKPSLVAPQQKCML